MITTDNPRVGGDIVLYRRTTLISEALMWAHWSVMWATFPNLAPAGARYLFLKLGDWVALPPPPIV